MKWLLASHEAVHYYLSELTRFFPPSARTSWSNVEAVHDYGWLRAARKTIEAAVQKAHFKPTH
jgi:hypothetical protein